MQSLRATCRSWYVLSPKQTSDDCKLVTTRIPWAWMTSPIVAIVSSARKGSMRINDNNCKLGVNINQEKRLPNNKQKGNLFVNAVNVTCVSYEASCGWWQAWTTLEGAQNSDSVYLVDCSHRMYWCCVTTMERAEFEAGVTRGPHGPAGPQWEKMSTQYSDPVHLTRRSQRRRIERHHGADI